MTKKAYQTKRNIELRNYMINSSERTKRKTGKLRESIRNRKAEMRTTKMSSRNPRKNLKERQRVNIHEDNGSEIYTQQNI